MLGIPPQQKTKYETYKYFTHSQRWVDLQAMFLSEATELFHVQEIPMLTNAIQVGISSMKTVFCNINTIDKEDQDMTISVGPLTTVPGAMQRQTMT